MKQVTTIGLDLAKQTFQVHGADADSSAVFNRRLRRAEVLGFFEKQPSCLIGIEVLIPTHQSCEIARPRSEPLCQLSYRVSGRGG